MEEGMLPQDSREYPSVRFPRVHSSSSVSRVVGQTNSPISRKNPWKIRGSPSS